mmetsp:Transcript_18068/g.16363  ORF Transcript_18068/g.16363 Transcript_18068/m.16363 type:complete len:561 (-) Transcript_18068:150-1832(-)
MCKYSNEVSIKSNKFIQSFKKNSKNSLLDDNTPNDIDKNDIETPELSVDEDEKRLNSLGYTQEIKRIFSGFTNFGLAASMISILLGVIPLYTFELQSGGPVIMVWSWIIIGAFTMLLVSSLAEIASAYPTMGALYYWAYRLGGPTWGPFASWIAGWCNLLGQIAGVASGAYAGAQIFGEILALTSNIKINGSQILGLYALMLFIAGIINTFAEVLLTSLCYISFVWQVAGTLVIVIWMLVKAPKLQTASFVFFQYNNNTGFDSLPYVALIGSLAAASVFTGYDTAAHVAEETHQAHTNAPLGMIGSVINAIILGLILIIGMNFCIQDLNSIIGQDDDGSGLQESYVLLWRQLVGKDITVLFLVITLVAIECSNCANLTSAARMIYSFSRDGALPYSKLWYHVSKRIGSPVRAIWLSLIIAFLLGLPGLGSSTVLAALFSLTATGLYSSYIIPIILRVTVARETFKPKEFSLGKYSVTIGIISVVWGLFMTIVLCLPQAGPPSSTNINYSPILLFAVLIYSMVMWFASARKWFRVVVSPIPDLLRKSQNFQLEDEIVEIIE